jgi:hypothetical protein
MFRVYLPQYVSWDLYLQGDYALAARRVTNKTTAGKHPNGLEEATTGFEPVIGVLQTPALPLGYVAG